MPKNANILLIRHAEKPTDLSDIGLTVQGQERAMAYVIYFQNFQITAKVIQLQHLLATAQSSHSNRSYLTLQPLSHQLQLEIDNRYSDSDKDIVALATYLQTDPRFNEANTLICWHHEKLLQIAAALGASPSTVPSNWPDEAYGWLIQLSFDAHGAITTSVTIEQKLMYDDHNHPIT